MAQAIKKRGAQPGPVDSDVLLRPARRTRSASALEGESRPPAPATPSPMKCKRTKSAPRTVSAPDSECRPASTGNGDFLRPARRTRSTGILDVEAPPLAPATPSQNTPKRPKIAPAPDGKCRCAWSTIYTGAHLPEYLLYHDTEWGVPVTHDEALFEHLVLDGAQCGLSWSTILAKRPAYTMAFKQWDIGAVAAMTEEDVERLMQPQSGIVRHRGKIASAISNAHCVQEVQREHGSLTKYLYSFMPDGRPRNNAYERMADLPTKTAEAEAISKALKARGFKFVGPTMIYAMMEASGMVNDHTVGCFRRQAVIEMQAMKQWPP